MPAHLEESNTAVPILAPGTAEAALAIAERFGHNRCPNTAGTRRCRGSGAGCTAPELCYLEAAPRCRVKLLLLGKAVIKNQT